MNMMQKSKAIKNGLRKGFQDGSSKMAKRRCYGYEVGSDGELAVNPDEAKVVCWIFEQYLAGNSRVFPPPPANPDGTGKRLTNCSPMKNIPDGYCFKKRSAPALSKSKIMVSWIGISIPAPMRPLFLTRCSWRYSRRNSATPKSHRIRLP